MTPERKENIREWAASFTDPTMMDAKDEAITELLAALDAAEENKMSAMRNMSTATQALSDGVDEIKAARAVVEQARKRCIPGDNELAHALKRYDKAVTSTMLEGKIQALHLAEERLEAARAVVKASRNFFHGYWGETKQSHDKAIREIEQSLKSYDEAVKK